ncbi:unnamed protein product, partial [Brachionus calyciflorus]
FGYIDEDDDAEKLNESTHSLSLNENLLTNISYSLDKQQMIMKDLADKTLSFQSQQKEKTSSSESSSEEDERYQVFN